MRRCGSSVRDLVRPKVYTAAGSGSGRRRAAALAAAGWVLDRVDWYSKCRHFAAWMKARPDLQSRFDAGFGTRANDVSPDNLRSMQIDSVCDANCRLPADWKPTALEISQLQPILLQATVLKGKR